MPGDTVPTTEDSLPRHCPQSLKLHLSKFVLVSYLSTTREVENCSTFTPLESCFAFVVFCTFKSGDMEHFLLYRFGSTELRPRSLGGGGLKGLGEGFQGCSHHGFQSFKASLRGTMFSKTYALHGL